MEERISLSIRAIDEKALMLKMLDLFIASFFTTIHKSFSAKLFQLQPMNGVLYQSEI